jgi:AcrR family transcriptional regulator
MNSTEWYSVSNDEIGRRNKRQSMNSSNIGAKPRVKPKEIREQEIQAAARKVFFKKGYQRSTIAEIANLAGIRQGTVYLHFKNKEDLYVSLMIPAVVRIGTQLKKLEMDIFDKKIKKGSTLMRRLADAHLDLYKYDREGLKIIQAFLQGYLFPGMSGEIEKKLNNLARINFQTIRRIISEGKNLGLIKWEVDEFFLADIIWALFIGVVQVEETKERFSKKRYLYPTLKYGFSLIDNAILQRT